MRRAEARSRCASAAGAAGPQKPQLQTSVERDGLDGFELLEDDRPRADQARCRRRAAGWQAGCCGEARGCGQACREAGGEADAASA